MTLIYHIISANDWQQAQNTGEYRGTLEQEGFIHASRLDQVLKVANAFYAEQSDLLLLQIDTAGLTAPVVYEAPAHPQPTDAVSDTDTFPHIYGALNLDAVSNVYELTSVDGKFALPSELAESD